MQPNNWLIPGAIDAIASKSCVLPVGIDLAALDRHRPNRRSETDNRKLVLWNHRWEFDKAPETFARVIRRVAEEGIEFALAIAGEPGDNPNPALAALRDEVPDRVVHFGYLPSREDYARLLWRADVVVSTSRHEFFGVSTVEALYCECFPVVPAQHNYPALVPDELHGASLWRDEAHCVELLCGALDAPSLPRAPLQEHAAAYDWSRVGPAWRDALVELARGG